MLLYENFFASILTVDNENLSYNLDKVQNKNSTDDPMKTAIFGEFLPRQHLK